MRGDFGMSYVMHAPVLDQLRPRLANTAWIVASAMLLCVSFGIPIGIRSATKPNSFFSQCAMVFGLMGVSMPIFWLGLLLILLFSVNLGWLPSSGMDHGVKSLILPAITLGFNYMANIMRTTRSSMMEAIRQDFIRTARSKGLSDRRIMWRHALRPSSVSLLASAGVTISGLIAGTFVVELLLQLPGLGFQIISSINQDDYTVVQGITLIVAVAVVLINFVFDFIFTVVDPRIARD